MILPLTPSSLGTEDERLEELRLAVFVFFMCLLFIPEFLNLGTIN